MNVNRRLIERTATHPSLDGTQPQRGAGMPILLLLVLAAGTLGCVAEPTAAPQQDATGQDAVGDTLAAADGAGTADSLVTDAGATTTDAATTDASIVDAAVSDATAPDTSVLDTSPPDTTSADTSPADANLPPVASCKGTLQCSAYLTKGDEAGCSADPGCTKGGLQCLPLYGSYWKSHCPGQKTANLCTKTIPSFAKNYCKWDAGKCVFDVVCDGVKDKTSCKAVSGGGYCQWQGVTCIGLATKLGCDSAPNEQICKSAKGCLWSDCQVTNGGKEICDGLDNDCDGNTDLLPMTFADPCTDGDVCTGLEACKEGKCESTPALKCADVKCYSVACDKKKGCKYTSTADTCDDGKPCTTDSCDPKTGSCVNTVIQGC